MLPHIGSTMVNGKPNIAALIDATVEEVNRDLPPAQRAAPSPDLIILGLGSPYDSLNLINFFVALDDRLLEAHGQAMDFLESPEILDRTDNALTARDLAAFIETRLR